MAEKTGGDVEPVVPERIWIDWANVDARIFYYVRPAGIEVEAVEYVPRSKLDAVTAELSKADNEIVGYQEKLREQQQLLKRYELDFVDLMESGASEVKSLQSLCDGLQSQLLHMEKEVEAERSLKWIHFENAAKFDKEIRELKRQLARVSPSIQDTEQEVLGDAAKTFSTVPVESERQLTGQLIYVASRASVPERGAMWRDFRDRGVGISSTWIDESGDGETGDFGELWERIANEIAESAALVLYAEADDFPLKGAFIEAGIALGMGKLVIVCLPDLGLLNRTYRPIGSWIAHPLVTRCDDINAAVALASMPVSGEQGITTEPKNCPASLPESESSVTPAIEIDAAGRARQIFDSGFASVRWVLPLRCEPLPVHGTRVIDNAQQVIVADVYNEDVAQALVAAINAYSPTRDAAIEGVVEALREAVGVIFSGPLVSIGSLKNVYSAQVYVKDVVRWNDLLATYEAQKGKQ